MTYLRVLCLFFFCFFSVSAQEKDSNEVDEIIDSLFDEDSDKDVDDLLEELFKEQKDLEDLMLSFSNFNFLYSSVSYGSNTYFAGRSLGEDQFNIRPQITYINSKGFFVGASGSYFQQFDPQWNSTSLSVGYGKSLDKRKLFRVSGSYSRFFYPEGVESSYDNALSLGGSIRNKKRNFVSRLSVNFSFGEDTSLQISSGTYGVFKILDKKKYRLQFRPRLNIIAGNIISYIENEQDFEEVKNFNLLNIQFNIPFLFTTELWDVELGYNHNFPIPVANESNLGNTSFFSLSVGYLFEL